MPPRITTISNPTFNPDAAVLTFRSRAATLFKRDLPYRFLNLINCKCKVPAPRGDRSSPEFREQAFLRKLSKGKMDPLDTMLALVRLSEDEDHKPFSNLTKISVHQARRMLDNLEAHGELETALTDQVQKRETESREKGTELSDPQKIYLNFLQQLHTNHHSLVERLMECAEYKDENIELREDEGKRARIDSALKAAWEAVPKGDGANYSPSALLDDALVEEKDRRRALEGSKDQRKFGKNLKSFREDFSKNNEISTGPLSEMLTQAMRKSGIDYSHKIVQMRMEQLAEIPKDVQAELLPPLLEAMADVIDGVGSARSDLARALRDISRAIEETQSHIAVLDGMVAATKIKNPDVTDQQFEEAAYERLLKLPKNELRYLMAHVDTVKSSEKTELVQNALRRLANHIEVLDTIDECFQDCRDENWDAALAKMAALDDNRLAFTADFFDRHPWIPDFFQNLAEPKESALPLASIIHSLDERSHTRFGLSKPTSLSEAQKSERERFLEICDKNGGETWHALYTFFGIPDEPAELPG